MFGNGGLGMGTMNPAMGGFPANGSMAMSNGSGLSVGGLPWGNPAQANRAGPSQGLDDAGEHRGLKQHFPANGPLKLSQYKERLVTSNGCQSVYLAGSGCTVKYAYCTQRGYYPDAPDKMNQDSFCVLTNFGGDLEQMLFGVFDGHGENGTECSQFARTKLPKNFCGDSNFDTYPEVAYHNGFVITNQSLHAEREIDDTMSGTTGITTLLRGRLLYTANVGDSRAFLAERQGSQLVAVDLSSDQTPFRRDECARVKKSGARVLTLDQLEGLKDPNVECWGTEEEDDGDPPRLWAHNGMYPGTAFTRSIGDSAAERIGVHAEPEISIRRLEPNAEFLVVASDGVFEFMKSQEVANMVAQYDDPQEACLAICAEAYNLWLQYETRTDDITIIVVQFTGMEEMKPTGESQGDTEVIDPGTPERNTLTRRRTWGDNDAKRAMSHRGSDFLEEDEDYQPPKVAPKTQVEVNMLEEAVKSNFLFSHLNLMQRLMLYEVMVRRHVIPGEVVIKQGDRGNHFHVVEEGKFDVLVSQGDDPAELVHTYIAINGQHPSFGELSLMYGKPRAATVVARTQGSLWELDRGAFQMVMHKRDPKLILKLLQNVEVLEHLSIGQLQRLADAMHEVTYTDGEHIIRQGELGSEFYAIEGGEVVCTARRSPSDETEEPKEILRLGQFQYFGERALLKSDARGANIVACGKVDLLTVSRFELEALIGSLETVKQAREAWRDISHISAENAKQQAGALLQSPFNLADLKCNGFYFTEEVLAVASMEVENVGNQAVRLFSISDTVALGKQAQIVRASTIARTIPASIFIPPVIKTLCNQAVMADVLLLGDACPLHAMVDTYSCLDEPSARFLLAGAVLALEHMHMASILYRGLSANTILVSKPEAGSHAGYIQFVDLRFAKSGEGRTFSMVGPSEYMSPEVVGGRGASEASDWWSLGILAYWMVIGSTPFAQPGDDDLKICRRIGDYGIEDEVPVPSGLSSELRSLLKGLLTADPAARLGNKQGGVQGIKEHPFFKDMDWVSLISGTLEPPARLADAAARCDHLLPGNAFTPQSYTGDTSWLDAF